MAARNTPMARTERGRSAWLPPASVEKAVRETYQPLALVGAQVRERNSRLVSRVFPANQRSLLHTPSDATDSFERRLIVGQLKYDIDRSRCFNERLESYATAARTDISGLTSEAHRFAAITHGNLNLDLNARVLSPVLALMHSSSRPFLQYISAP